MDTDNNTNFWVCVIIFTSRFKLINVKNYYIIILRVHHDVVCHWHAEHGICVSNIVMQASQINLIIDV